METLANLGRGDRDIHVRQPLYLGRGGGLIAGKVRAGTADHNELHRSHDLLPTMPGVDLGESVTAKHEEQSVVRLDLRPCLLESIEGVARLAVGRGGFQTRGLEAGVAFACQGGHAVAVFVGGFGDGLPVGRPSCRDEENTVEVQPVGGRAGYVYVSAVHGVEGAAVQGYLHDETFTNTTLAMQTS